MKDDSRALASWERESVIEEERERYWHGRKPEEGEYDEAVMAEYDTED